MSSGDAGLLCDVSDGVMTLTLNRPDAYNALDYLTRDDLVERLAWASADLSVRVVVITGAGDKAFCTGADLRTRQPVPDKPDGAPERAQGDTARMIANGWQRVITAVLDCEKPVIAALNGTAAGAGMHLALACDLVIAADTAKLVPVFIRRGIAPDAGGAYLLTRLIGPQKTKELYFFGDDVSAAEALQIGIVNKVVPAGELGSAVAELTKRLAAAPTKAIGVTKALVNRALDVDRGTALAEEAWGQELVMTSEDAQEGVAAFIERRDPTYRGW